MHHCYSREGSSSDVRRKWHGRADLDKTKWSRAVPILSPVDGSSTGAVFEMNEPLSDRSPGSKVEHRSLSRPSTIRIVTNPVFRVTSVVSASEIQSSAVFQITFLSDTSKQQASRAMTVKEIPHHTSRSGEARLVGSGVSRWCMPV